MEESISATLSSSSHPDSVMQFFCALPFIGEVNG